MLSIRVTADGPSVFVSNPVVTLIQCEGNIFLAIIQVGDISIDQTSVLEIRSEFLVESVVTIQFQIYHITEITDPNNPDCNDNDWKWNCNMEPQILKI